MIKSSKPKIVAVVGATATGKTGVGIGLALEFGGEIVNCDSRLFYRGMDVATAKPSPDEKRGVPHHLIDILDPNERFSLAEFLAIARTTIADITSRGKLPVLVGGSGQYVWALLEGWEVPEIEPDFELRNNLEKRLEDDGVEAIANQLRDIAPEIAEKTDLANPRRVIRAIERVMSGATESESTRRKPDDPPFDSLIIGLSVERSVLHERVLQRLESMKNIGWVAEVESLRNAGFSDDGRAMSGIGYRQMLGHLAGDYDLDEAIRLTAVATNRLIRQQSNWFKQEDSRINWFDMTTKPENVIIPITEIANNWLQKC
ncbi:tRNA (adenosine(37)-N6)-dimethylallyltransferase MiaA [Dehalococcoides mccartyi]|nr:tRNA (adenosine(37)-N6)-dimethylallyltransferase MiaA [Dehalococcoides mccartyi]